MLPQMRTIKEAVAEFHAADPATAITETYLRRLVVTGQVPHVKAGEQVPDQYGRALALPGGPGEQKKRPTTADGRYPPDHCVRRRHESGQKNKPSANCRPKQKQRVYAAP